MPALCDGCRGQVGKQVIEHLSVKYVRDLAAYQAQELIEMFGTATGNRRHANVCALQLGLRPIFNAGVRTR